jgi:hypothetical protein
MLQTTATGAANVAAATGESFHAVLGKWALANWVSDLAGFSAPAELKYNSWSFRTTYASLHSEDSDNFPKPFPLTPTQSTGRQVDLSGTLRAGSGVYHLATQAPNSGAFTLRFTNSGGSLIGASLFPRLTVIRIQ